MINSTNIAKGAAIMAAGYALYKDPVGIVLSIGSTAVAGYAGWRVGFYAATEFQERVLQIDIAHMRGIKERVFAACIAADAGQLLRPELLP